MRTRRPDQEQAAMQDLTLVGLTEDRTKLVLASDTGERFTLPVDAKLRAAVRGDLARLGQGEIRMDSALRPRDIQARIRAGESPQNVAEAAHTTIERVMTYATPVLAERAHIADRAQRASVRRRAGEGPARMLGDAVAERLRATNVDPESVDWDSWRREDGRWTLVAAFRAAERNRRAEFIFDVQGRYVVAEDDDARWLVGEPVISQPSPAPAPVGPRRLSAVGREEELPFGDDAIDLVTREETEAAQADSGPDESTASGSEEPTVDLTRPARELRAGTPHIDELAVTGDADWMATQASDRPSRPRPATPPQPDPVEQTTETEALESPEPNEPDETTEPAQPAEPVAKKSGRKSRRASVPSWDEIMFGGGRSE